MRRTRGLGGWIGWSLRATATAIVAQRLLRTARRDPPLERHDIEEALPVNISVVIPARNEEARLGPCLDALEGAPGVLEIIVVDDQSHDATAEVARAGGARVLTGVDRPPGWAGKTWALAQGIDAARGDWIVTLDADARPDPSLPMALVRRARADGVDLATVAGAFECPNLGSTWLHPAMLTTLVYRFGAPPGVIGPGQRVLANGQCMAVDREKFLAAGGLERVAHHMVEDVALARATIERGGRAALYDGAELLTVRMYEDLAQTWTGWGRSLALGRAVSRAEAITDVAVVAVMGLAPWWRLLRGRCDLVDIVAILIRLGTLVGTSASYRPRRWSYWLSPGADPLAIAALIGGVIAPDRRWRGRRAPSGPPERNADRSAT